MKSDFRGTLKSNWELITGQVVVLVSPGFRNIHESSCIPYHTIFPITHESQPVTGVLRVFDCPLGSFSINRLW